MKFCNFVNFMYFVTFYVVEINIFDTIFAFVSIIMYKPENWPILADYLVKLAGQFLYFNRLSKNTNFKGLQLP